MMQYNYEIVLTTQNIFLKYIIYDTINKALNSRELSTSNCHGCNNVGRNIDIIITVFVFFSLF